MKRPCSLAERVALLTYFLLLTLPFLEASNKRNKVRWSACGIIDNVEDTELRTAIASTSPTSVPVDSYLSAACPNINASNLPSSENFATATLVETKTAPSFVIAIHDKEFDHLRWPIQETGLYYEVDLTEAAERFLKGKPPGVVVDVGANIGWFGLYVAAMGHTVHAFEPNPSNQLRLCQSVAVNRFCKHLHVVPKAVSNEPGFAHLHWNRNPGSARIFDVRKGGFVHGVETPVTTIDSYFEGKLHDILAMKVDIEGFEPMALAGAANLIHQCTVHMIYVEVSATKKLKLPVGYVRMMTRLATTHVLLEVHPAGNYTAPMTAAEVVKRVDGFNANPDPRPLLNACKRTDSGQCNLLWVVKDTTPKCT